MVRTKANTSKLSRDNTSKLSRDNTSRDNTIIVQGYYN